MDPGGPMVNEVTSVWVFLGGPGNWHSGTI